MPAWRGVKGDLVLQAKLWGKAPTKHDFLSYPARTPPVGLWGNDPQNDSLPLIANNVREERGAQQGESESDPWESKS